jgi:hypothetical protein
MSLDNIAQSSYQNSIQIHSNIHRKHVTSIASGKKIKRNFIFFIFWPEGPSYMRGPRSHTRCPAHGAQRARNQTARRPISHRSDWSSSRGPAGSRAARPSSPHQQHSHTRPQRGLGPRFCSPRLDRFRPQEPLVNLSH